MGPRDPLGALGRLGIDEKRRGMVLPQQHGRGRVVEECFIAEHDQVGLLDQSALEDRLLVDPRIRGDRRPAALGTVHGRVLHLITREERGGAEDPACRLDPVSASAMKSDADHEKPPTPGPGTVDVSQGGTATIGVWLSSTASSSSPDVFNEYGVQLQITGPNFLMFAPSGNQNFSYLNNSQYVFYQPFGFNNSFDYASNTPGGYVEQVNYSNDTFIGSDSTNDLNTVSMSSSSFWPDGDHSRGGGRSPVCELGRLSPIMGLSIRPAEQLRWRSHQDSPF
jgi:hypothetical protein